MLKEKPSEDYAAFERLTDQLLRVPKAVLDVRVKAHKAASAANPNRPGRKPKAKPSDH
jgi:hypothetical protein